MSAKCESDTTMEALTLRMTRQFLKGVVALKGLPSTGKTELAHHIGKWAKCPALCIQDFLGEGAGLTSCFKGAEADFSPPTATDQVERHHRKAFTSLLSVARRLLYYDVFNCAVIKSSLTTLFELAQLLQLTHEYTCKFRLIIIECKIRNKYLWKLRFESLSVEFEESRSWSRPRSWKEIQKAVDDDDQPPSWDLNHLHHLLKGMHQLAPYVVWLGVDPFYDLALSHRYPTGTFVDPLPEEFTDAIKYLLTAPKQELPQNPYVVEYDDLRRLLFEKRLRAAARKGRSQSFCQGSCVFGYRQVLEDYTADFCGVCEEEISRNPAYICHFCVTTLHKTCAERFDIKALLSANRYVLEYFDDQVSVQDPCKTCKGGGREFSEECRSCLFQDRLKCHLVPTIFNHNCHQHFLSFQPVNQDYHCKACGVNYCPQKSYGCKRCAFYCHIHCVFLPLELKHEHGGHEHVMKLMYSRDAMEEEEDPCWCDCCYEDMDPELWFYSCQECPHYVVHLQCSCGYELGAYDPKMVKLVEQLQSQLDDWSAAGNSIEPC